MNITIENTGTKYSEMLIIITKYFYDQFNEKIALNEIVEIVIEAWNLANNKINLGEKLYKKEIKAHKKVTFFEKIVDYKLAHFADFNNSIVDYTLENDILKVRSQSPDQQFNSIIVKMMNTKPTTKR